MFRTVLWASDGSAAADRALPAAKSIAEKFGAKLLVTHVIEGVSAPITVQSGEETDDETQATLQARAEGLTSEGISVELVTLDKSRSGTAQAIADLARERNVDLIVAGTRGSSQLMRFLVGSVTRRLVELAPCPVLAVPPDVEERKK